MPRSDQAFVTEHAKTCERITHRSWKARQQISKLDQSMLSAISDIPTMLPQSYMSIATAPASNAVGSLLAFFSTKSKTSLNTNSKHIHVTQVSNRTLSKTMTFPFWNRSIHLLKGFIIWLTCWLLKHNKHFQYNYLSITVK